MLLYVTFAASYADIPATDTCPTTVLPVQATASLSVGLDEKLLGCVNLAL